MSDNLEKTPTDIEHQIYSLKGVNRVSHEIVYDKDDNLIIIFNITLTFWSSLKSMLSARYRNKTYLRILDSNLSIPEGVAYVIKLVL